MSLFKELQRRNVFRVSAGYALSCWLLAQVADLVLDNIGAPAWVMQTVMLFMVLGMPFVVFFSWAYEVTADGVRRQSDLDGVRTEHQPTARRLDRVIMTLLVVAVVYFAVDKFYLDPGETAANPEAVVAGATAAPETARSIAVLPFVNMSDDESNEYFSEGLSEELLNVLAKNPDLRVAARTSSFSLKGQPLEISEIGSRLNVAYVVEGSVRRAGNQARITAQLIKADDGYHLWSETYDRTLDDVFVLQEEIAGRITRALLPQIIGDDAAIADGATSGYAYAPPAEVYQQYLLARSLFNKHTRAQMKQAADILAPLVRENPGYAEAQALYAHAVFSSSVRTGGDIPWIIAEAQVRKGIREALALNPRLAEAHLVEGRLLYRNLELAAAMEAYDRAIALSPSYAEAYVYLAEAALQARQEDRVWEALDQAKQLDPLSPSLLIAIAEAGIVLDREDVTDSAISTLAQLDPELASEQLASLYFNFGKIARAAVQLEKHRANFPASTFGVTMLAYEYGRLGMSAEASAISPQVAMLIAAQQGREAEALQMMEEQAAEKTDPHDRADVYWTVYFALGYRDRALEVLSDLWYGYAEEQMGPRMDWLDTAVFGMLLREAGRHEEALRVAEVQKRSDTGRTAAATLIAEGRLDDAVEVLKERADKGDFDILGIQFFPFYVGLDQHPDYPDLLARAEAWRQQEYALYLSLKAAEHP